EYLPEQRDRLPDRSGFAFVQNHARSVRSRSRNHARDAPVIRMYAGCQVACVVQHHDGARLDCCVGNVEFFCTVRIRQPDVSLYINIAVDEEVSRNAHISSEEACQTDSLMNRPYRRRPICRSRIDAHRVCTAPGDAGSADTLTGHSGKALRTAIGLSNNADTRVTLPDDAVGAARSNASHSSGAIL